MIRRTRLVLIAILLAAALPVPAQEATPPALKAAFVANFAKFVKWPDSALPRGGQFRFCVMGDADVVDELGRLLKVRRQAGANILVAAMTDEGVDPSELRLCHVLYLSGRDQRKVAAALQDVKGAPIFTVSDLHGFASQMGGIAELYLQDDRMRFAINLENAQRTSLHLDAPMLSLAKIVGRPEK